MSILLGAWPAASRADQEAPAAAADPAAAPRLKLGGFVDTYFSYNFNGPSDRANFFPGVATSAKRHNETNVNLAAVDVSLEPRPVGFTLRVGLGTSTEIVHALEPAGTAVGPEVWNNVVQALVQWNTGVGRGLLLEGGIYPSHIGLEAFATKDNWNYTRSWLGELLPYYYPPRQDRHHHSGQPHGQRVPARARGHRGGAGRRGPARQPGRRDAGRPVDRGPGQREVRLAGARPAHDPLPLRGLLRPDPHERLRRGRSGDPQGSGGRHRSPRLRAGGTMPAAVEQTVSTIAQSGGTPLAVSVNERVLGIVHLKDKVKGGLRERFDRFRAMGLRTVMITGDNSLTRAPSRARRG